MCGFVGFVDKNKDKEKIIQDMKEKIYHRGPDSDGTYVDKNVALGFRRLSIIDLASGAQPIYNEDKSMVIMFNGEIYNFQDLREELINKGHKFETKADTEVLIHGYEEYGKDLLNKLRGMFAFVIWDIKKEEMIIARDFFGIKPMYYYQNDDTFMFGSEIKSFLAHPNFKKELNEEALENYLSFQYSVGEDTFFKNVKKLLPGHYLIYKEGKIEINKYFEIEFNVDNEKSLEDHVKDIEKVYADSIQAHKVSDVEIGSFLSSGIDSSYAACLAKVDKTFTVGFDSKENANKYNEITYAKDLSQKIGVENISKKITKEEFFEALPHVMYHMDEPLADGSCIALWFVTKITSEHVKVALSGEGADELFGGYHGYEEPFGPSWYMWIPFPLRRAVSKFFGLFPGHKGINFLVRKGQTVEEKYFGDNNGFSTKERKKALRIKTKAKATKEITKPYYDKVKDQQTVEKMQYLDLNLYMVGDILLKADKMSMAHSLEVRVPFLDKEVLKVATTIPSKYKLKDGTTKYALRQAAKKTIPTDAYKKRKLAFPVPIVKWLAEDDTYEAIKKEFDSEVACKYFNHKYITKLLEDHRKGKNTAQWRKIWCIYVFLIWYKQYFELN